MSVNGLSMMKRQFLRVKQIADQTFQRGEKTEVLTDELTAAEKRVELIRQSCQNSGKKLSSCMQRMAPEGATADRRSPKKTPEAQLAQCMEEWGLGLGEGSILGVTMVDCARIQDALATDLVEFKASIEESVVEPLQNILKVDVANVAKCRKQLAKLTADMDAVKLKLQAAVKNCQQVSNTGLAAAVSKADALKEESEDAVTKVDQCRDMLATEMFNLISREPELARLFVRQCQLQLEYHRAAVAVLESNLPEMETQISNWPYHPVFGIPLEDHLRYSKREIAVVIETCICWLLDKAMDEEGLFRIGGSVTKIKKMKSAFDANVSHLIEDEKDPHNTAGVLKLYLRSLPEPLLTYSLYNDWMEAVRIRDHDKQLQALWTVVNSLPVANFKNLRYLVKFLSKLCQNSEKNKMSSQNLAIVMGPNLLWSPVADGALGMNMTATNYYSSIVDSLITYADWFFPGDLDFHVSTPTSPRNLNGFPGSLRDSQLSLSTTKLSNGDSAVDSLSSSPTNSPKSPSPRVTTRTKKKAPVAPNGDEGAKYQITRSLSCGIFQPIMKDQAARAKKLSQQSQSHEDLLSMDYDDGSSKTDGISSSGSPKSARAHTYPTKIRENMGYNSVPVIKPARSKPRVNGLPPLLEKTAKKERPSFPPPAIPPTARKPAEAPHQAADANSEPPPTKHEVVDVNDISILLTAENKKQGGAPISFMDDSDFEEDKQPAASGTKDVDPPEGSAARETEGTVVIGAGMPAWFDHYSKGRRPSDSVWFSLTEVKQQESRDPVDDSVFHEDIQSPVVLHTTTENSKNDSSSPRSPDSEQFRTVIAVGDDDDATENNDLEDHYLPVYKFSPPKDTAIKLKVNGETQNTKL